MTKSVICWCEEHSAKIEHLKETDTVCHTCEVLKLTAYVVLPVIIPFTLYSFSTLY